jgi:hypothetical protein
VAELGEAKAELAKLLLRSPNKKEEGGARKWRGDLLLPYMRLCRARSTLRQWDGRHEAAGEGLEACASRCGGEGGNARLASYREQASSISSPADATPPVMVCADIAGDAAEHTEYPGSPKEAFPQVLSNEIDKGTECAMQLMRLGPN